MCPRSPRADSSSSAEVTLLSIEPAALEEWLLRRGERPFRARQILAWVHKRLVPRPAEMTDLPAALREELAASELGREVGAVDALRRSADGTRKISVRLADGGLVETVLIPDGPKLTQCISTQVGCAYACAFCKSGQHGLGRNLTADEVLCQVHLAREHWDAEERLSNVVLMGSGEPLANYPATRRSLQVMTAPWGMDLSTRRVTVSTVGLPRGIARLGADFDGRIGLAVSLHGADDATRSRLVGTLAPEVSAITKALRGYPLPKRRRITIEYVLAKGVNDDVGQARALARLLRGLRVKVNLIPVNEHPSTDLRSPEPAAVERFRDELDRAGLTAIVRRERGADIHAACGQLAAAAVADD